MKCLCYTYLGRYSHKNCPFSLKTQVLIHLSINRKQSLLYYKSLLTFSKTNNYSPGIQYINHPFPYIPLLLSSLFISLQLLPSTPNLFTNLSLLILLLPSTPPLLSNPLHLVFLPSTQSLLSNLDFLPSS